MRAIDGDHLKRWILARWTENEKRGNGQLHTGDILDQIDRELTIEPERKTGEWIPVNEQPYFRKHFHKVCCSNCFTKGYEHWKFCPSCGADMRGEHDDR